MSQRNDEPTEYNTVGAPINRGTLRRFNSMICLTVFCTLVVLIIIATLVVFTFLPILSPVHKNQTHYQIQSDILIFRYDLPDRSFVNRTFIIGDFPFEKLIQLQKMLQDRLMSQKSERKISMAVMDATINRFNVSKTDSIDEEDENIQNRTIVLEAQSANRTENISKLELVMKVMLRFSFECGKKCQTAEKASIIGKTFQRLELSIDEFRNLMTEESKSPTTTTSPVTIPSSTVIIFNYEAESSSNRLILATVEFCSICSGQQKVSRIGRGGELIFQNLVSRSDGPTWVMFFYTTDRLRSAELLVNDRFPTINITFPPFCFNEQLASLPVLLDLHRGFNTIRISNSQDEAPDFDRIQIH